jgi:hypothetical protein
MDIAYNVWKKVETNNPGKVIETIAKVPYNELLP